MKGSRGNRGIDMWGESSSGSLLRSHPHPLHRYSRACARESGLSRGRRGMMKLMKKPSIPCPVGFVTHTLTSERLPLGPSAN